VAEHSSRQPRKIQENIADPAVLVCQRRRQRLHGEREREETRGEEKKKAAATARRKG
jgi:hypothetical protein